MEETLTVMDTLANLLTPFSFDFMNKIFKDLSPIIGFPTDQLRYVFCLFAMYPLALLYLKIPYGTGKHVFSIISGILTAQLVLGTGWLHSLFTSTVTYFIVAFAPLPYVSEYDI